MVVLWPTYECTFIIRKPYSSATLPWSDKRQYVQKRHSELLMVKVNRLAFLMRVSYLSNNLLTYRKLEFLPINDFWVLYSADSSFYSSYCFFSDFAVLQHMAMG